LKLKGKFAAVTGSGTGIGRATAVAFAAEGAAKIALIGRRKDLLEETGQFVSAHGAVPLVIACDLTAPDEAKRAIREAAESFGGLDLLVNNAGIYEPGTVLSTDEETWDRTLDLNLKAVFLCSREALNHMIPRGGGSIVNIASYLGLIATRHSAAYCASKGGVVLLTKAMALDHASQNIRVNCLCPGGVDTPMMRASEPSPADMQRWADEHPLGRVATPEEIALAAVYLCSTDAAFITGAALPVDGGISAGW